VANIPVEFLVLLGDGKEPNTFFEQKMTTINEATIDEFE
jgi:hypothetical protein